MVRRKRENDLPFVPLPPSRRRQQKGHRRGDGAQQGRSNHVGATARTTRKANARKTAPAPLDGNVRPHAAGAAGACGGAGGVAADVGAGGVWDDLANEYEGGELVLTHSTSHKRRHRHSLFPPSPHPLSSHQVSRKAVIKVPHINPSEVPNRARKPLRRHGAHERTTSASVTVGAHCSSACARSAVALATPPPHGRTNVWFSLPRVVWDRGGGLCLGDGAV